MVGVDNKLSTLEDVAEKFQGGVGTEQFSVINAVFFSVSDRFLEK